MSYQIYLHCDAGHDGCLNNGQLPNGRYKNIIAGSYSLGTLSEKQGWVYERGLGHICPNCKARRDARAA